MKVLWRTFFLLGIFSPAWAGDAFPHDPGNFFIREKISSLDVFQKAFDGQKAGLKANGFSAYSLHRDLDHPDHVILTLKCSDLSKGRNFVYSKGFHEAMTKANVEDAVVWMGTDVMERHYSDRPHPPAGSGIVIAVNKVKSYDFWKKCWDAEGHHNHPGRGYRNSDYSISRLKTHPETVIVAHEASDISKAPAFMTSAPMKGVMESVGVIGLEIWYGVNLEEGVL